MKNVLNQEAVTNSPGVPSHRPAASFLRAVLYLSTGLLITLALASGAALLLNDVAPHLFTGLSHAPISAAPLLLIGTASLGFQILTRPRLLDLFKALLISSAFILWGIDQMLPSGWLATTIGDIVIVLYVIDLGWIMIDSLKHKRQFNK